MHPPDASRARVHLGKGRRADPNVFQLEPCVKPSELNALELLGYKFGRLRGPDLVRLGSSRGHLVMVFSEEALEVRHRAHRPSARARAAYDWPVQDVPTSFPGHELVSSGLADLAAGRESESSLLVTMAAPRLRRLGFDVPAGGAARPSHRLYELLTENLGAHSRYNALVGRIVSFARAAEHASSG